MQTNLYLTGKDHGRPLSLEEFLTADYQEGFRYEIIRGRLYVSPLPNLVHEDLRIWLQLLLQAYVKERPDRINRVYTPARVFLPEKDEVTAPEPDLAAYRDFPRERVLQGLCWQEVSPVLVVEVLSADTADKDLTRNPELFIQVSSIQEYWIIDFRDSIQEPSLTVYRRRDRRRWRRPIEVEGGKTYTTDLLPGFTLTLQFTP